MTADDKEFDAVVRIDTPGEADYYRHGGIMQYVLRSLRARPGDPVSASALANAIARRGRLTCA